MSRAVPICRQMRVLARLTAHGWSVIFQEGMALQPDVSENADGAIVTSKPYGSIQMTGPPPPPPRDPASRCCAWVCLVRAGITWLLVVVSWS